MESTSCRRLRTTSISFCRAYSSPCSDRRWATRGHWSIPPSTFPTAYEDGKRTTAVPTLPYSSPATQPRITGLFGTEARITPSRSSAATIARGGKGKFYASVGVRELLIVDRYPWCLELYQINAYDMELVGTSDLREHAIVTSAVLPLTFQLKPGNARPGIEIVLTKTGQQWLI